MNSHQRKIKRRMERREAREGKIKTPKSRMVVDKILFTLHLLELSDQNKKFRLAYPIYRKQDVTDFDNLIHQYKS